jgi:glycosyltransferase involved in cell wall biosynthesis
MCEKKILIFSKSFYPAIGGVQSTSRILADTLTNFKYQVTVFTSTMMDSNTTELYEGYRIIRSVNWLYFTYLCYQSDLIIIKGGVSAIAGMSAWLTHTPYLIYHEMIGSYLYNHNYWKALFSNSFRKILVKDAIGHIGVTKACLDSKNISSSQSQFVIYNPVSVELERIAKSFNLNQKPKYDILFVGRLIKTKGIYVLADALKLFEQNGIKVKACFVGSGEDVQLQEYLSCCHIVGVDFLGSLKGEKLAYAYTSARLSVIPSTHPEGMGLVIAEAFMFDLPVIGSSQPAIKEVINHEGLVFENGSTEDLYQKLYTILFDKDLYQNYRLHVQQQKEKFTCNVYVDKIRSCLDMIKF